jgi:hypothetical protein
MNTLLEILDGNFAQIAAGWGEVVHELSSDTLYRKPNADSRSLSSGEHVVRSARIVEQTFGGITANLWDDPFEWTLPETLSTPEDVLDYLHEVEATRRRGFELIKTEEDLTKEIMAASGPTQLLSLLLDTLMRAGHHLLSAREVFKQLSSEDSRVTPTANING